MEKKTKTVRFKDEVAVYPADDIDRKNPWLNNHKRKKKNVLNTNTFKKVQILKNKIIQHGTVDE